MDIIRLSTTKGPKPLHIYNNDPLIRVAKSFSDNKLLILATKSTDEIIYPFIEDLF